MASIEIRGIDPLIKQLDSLERAQDIVEPVLSRWSQRIGDEWHTYPPRLPNQQYVRTGNLGRGRRQLVRRSSNRISAIARNTGVDYNVWVLQASTQAGIHRGRWATDEGLIDKYENDIVRDVGDAINRAMGG